MAVDTMTFLSPIFSLPAGASPARASRPDSVLWFRSRLRHCARSSEPDLRSLLRRRELHPLRMGLVERVERVAARHQTVAGRRGAVAERAADQTPVEAT